MIGIRSRASTATTLLDFLRRWFANSSGFGILVERALSSDRGATVLARVGEQVAAVSLDGEDETVLVSARTARQYDIDFAAFCHQFRAANRLRGRELQSVHQNAVWLGAVGRGSRRREFYVVRGLNARNAGETALALKGRASGAPVTILTPTERNLTSDILKRLSADQIAVVAIEHILTDDDQHPFAISIPAVRVAAAPSETERLTVDTQGHRARFDGGEVKLTRRDFAVLVLLANELTDQNGIVPRSSISVTIRDSTGNDDTNEEQIEKTISRLRSALRKAGGLSPKAAKTLIKMTRRVGYQLMLAPDAARVHSILRPLGKRQLQERFRRGSGQVSRPEHGHLPVIKTR